MFFLFYSIYIHRGILGIIVLFITSNNKKLSKYFLISLIPLSFDILLNIGIINYWLFAIKYSIVFILLTRITCSNKNNPFNKASRIIFNFYLLSFIASLPFLLGYDIFPELDPSILRKNIEGNGGRNLYTVTALFSGYLTGEFPVRIFDIPISRFTSFHIEPSNFTLYFVPLTIINWKYLNYFKKILVSLMILFSFSVTTFIVLPVIFIFKFLFMSKRNKFVILFLSSTLLIGVLTSSNYIFKYTSVGKLIYYKVFVSNSFKDSLNQKNIVKISNFFVQNSFNKLPAQSESSGINLVSILLWMFFLISVITFSYRKKMSNRLALTYFLIHGLKSASHIYPSFFLLYLLFINNRVGITKFSTVKKI